MRKEEEEEELMFYFEYWFFQIWCFCGNKLNCFYMLLIQIMCVWIHKVEKKKAFLLIFFYPARLNVHQIKCLMGSIKPLTKERRLNEEKTQSDRQQYFD